MSVDGQIVTNFDPHAYSYTVKGSGPLEYHTIAVYTNQTSATSDATTTADVATMLINDVLEYIWAIAAICMIVIGLGSRNRIWSMFCLLLVAPFLSLFGFATYIQQTGIMITDIWHLPFFIYGALFIVSLVLWASKR
jgi:hypothetical protein